jgi:hypothetical protein
MLYMRPYYHSCCSTGDQDLLPPSFLSEDELAKPSVKGEVPQDRAVTWGTMILTSLSSDLAPLLKKTMYPLNKTALKLSEYPGLPLSKGLRGWSLFHPVRSLPL